MKVYEVSWWEHNDDLYRSWFADEEEALKFRYELKATDECELVSLRIHEVPKDPKAFAEWLNSYTH